MPRELSDYEHQTHDLFKAHLDVAANWTSEKQTLCNIFNAFPTASYCCTRLEQIAAAVYGLDTISLQRALTDLCRAKVMRARMNRGLRLYEVNY